MSLTAITSARFYDVLVISVGLGLLLGLVRGFIHRTWQTKLSGPTRTNWLFGFNRVLNEGVSGNLFKVWQKIYGEVFEIPTAMGGKRIVLMDPRAVAYVWNGNPYNFWRPEGSRIFLRRMIGGGILVAAESDAHKRHRRAMSPGFTPAAIRAFTSIFLDEAHKVSEQWNALAADSKFDDLRLNVETWLNCISLDSIGLAGFSHSFNCVRGERPAIMNVLASFGKTNDFFTLLVIALLQEVPAILRIPLGRNKLSSRLHDASIELAKKLLKERKAESKEEAAEWRSIISSLIKAENRTLSEDEVLAELNTLMLAGYETTSTTMAWCFHELSINPEVQNKLRRELRRFPDPSHDQLANDMPYLDAVVKETLRTHPVVPENHRVAVADEEIPLLHSVQTTDGKYVNSLRVRRGTGIIIPIEAINRSTLIWGPDAHVFDPDRWLKGDLPAAAQEMQGYHHLLTFINGPRHCIGQNFAVAEIKAVVSVLVRNFVVKPLTDGKDVFRNGTVTPRGRNKGMDGLFLHVSRAESD